MISLRHILENDALMNPLIMRHQKIQLGLDVSCSPLSYVPLRETEISTGKTTPITNDHMHIYRYFFQLS